MLESQDGRLSVATRVELHEADVWARCVELAARVDGDPLGATVDRHGPVPLPALTAVDSSTFNRVVGLGVGSPGSVETVQRIDRFYLDHAQDHYRVEIAPGAGPEDLPERLAAIGLVPVAETVTKVYRCFAGTVPDDLSVSVDRGAVVRRLSHADAEEVAALSVRAWGAWHVPVPLGPWFAASVGAEGFTHYGAFIEGRLVCTGAMAVDGELAWIGFDATHPRHQSRQLRRALTGRRIADALAEGCRIVHAEADSDRLSSRARMLDSQYDRRLFMHRPRTGPP